MKKYYCILFLITNHLIGFAQITPLRIASESSDSLKVNGVDKGCCNENSNLETVFIALDEILKQKYTQEKLISVKHDSIKGEEFVSHRASVKFKESVVEKGKDSSDIDYKNFKFHFDSEIERLSHNDTTDNLIPTVVNYEIGGLRFVYIFDQYTYSQELNNHEVFTINTNCAIRVFTKDSISGDVNPPIDFISAESFVEGTASDFAEQEFNLQVSGKTVYQRQNKNVTLNNVQQVIEALDSLISNLEIAGFDIVWSNGRLISLMYGGIGFTHE